MDDKEAFERWYRARLLHGAPVGVDATSEYLKRFYASLLNGLRGLQDDFAVADVPAQANEYLAEIIEICESDYRVTFGDHD